MQYALITNSAPAEITGSAIETSNVQFSYQTMLLWSDSERAAHGIYPITDDAITDGKVATGSTLEFTNGAVARHWTLEDAPPPPVPEDISDRQFAQALALNGLITNVEALEWVKVGTVPQQLQAIIDAMTDTEQQFAANMLLGGATTFQRHHPMVALRGGALGKTSDEIDDIWRLAVTL